MYGVFWDQSKLNGLGDVAIKSADLLQLFWEPGIKDIDSIKNFIAEEVHLGDASKETYKMAEQKASETRELILSALDEAIENYKGTERRTEGGVRNSLNVNEQAVRVVDGTPIISGHAFSNNLIKKSYGEVTKAIQGELRKLANNKYIIDSDNREVYIGNDFADEYKGSKDTWSKNANRRKAKSNAIGGIEKIIETAKNPRWEENKEEKHNEDAKRGWTYYDIGFGIENPNNNKITYYDGSLNVRMDADEKDYVYDITKIKEGDRTHSKGGQKSVLPPYESSISSSQKKSSTNSGDNEVRHALDVDSGEIAQKAEKYFGTTRRFDLAGYLDVNGKLLDFSDGQKYRVQDHREISEILDLPEDAGYSDGLIQFMGMGNIRLNPYGIDIAVKPNEAQKDKLYDFFESLDGEVTVDFSTPTKGDTVGSADYSEGTSPRRIINDIESYFDTGEVPEGTDDGNVYYSLNISPDEQTEIQNEVDELQKELDEWDGRKSGHFKVSNTPKVLNKIGIPSADIEIDKSKVKKIFADHPEMKKLLPQIPRILHDPVIVLDSKTVDGAYVIYGNVFDGNKPVLVSLLVNPTNRRGVTLDVHKVSSSYAKDNAQRQLNESNVRYINPDKEITTNWERLTRLQLPFVPPTISGSFDEIIPHTQKNASTNSGENDIRHALDVADEDESGYTLSENGDIVDADGHTYPVVEGRYFSKSDIKKNERLIKNLIKEELSKLVGNTYTIKSSGQKVIVGKDMPGEYVESKDVNIYRKKTKRVKFNVFDELPDMIENAWDKRYDVNTEAKHNTNAKRGWNYYKVGVAVKTGNAYSTYNGKLNIRLDADGNDYVYDITEINEASSFHPSRVMNQPDASSGNSIASSQKKSSTNSGKNDIRHALNIDDGFEDWIAVSTMSDEEFYKEYGGFLDDDTAAGVYVQSAKNLSDSMKTMSGLLQAANETLKGTRVDDTVILRLAKKIKAEYGSNMSANQISERLSMVFDYLQNSEKVDYEDMVKILQEVSDDIINESTQIDTSAWDEMREVLKERSFTLGEYQKDEVRNDYGNIKNFRQQYFGILDVARDGSGISSLDSQWGEIADALGLDRDIPDTAQIAALTEYIESVRPVAENIYGESKEEYAYDLAMRIMTDYYKAVADNMVDTRVERAISNGEAGESAKESLKKYRKKMMSEVNTFRKATKEAYEKNFSAAEAQIAAQQESIKDLNTYIKRQNNIITTLDGEKKILNDRFADEREINIKLTQKQRDYAKRKAYNKLAVKQYRDMQQIKAEKEKITKIGAQFYRMLNKPTDKQHILDGMQKPIAEFLLGIDFISDRAKTGSESTIRWQEKFRALEDWVHKAIEGKVEGEASGLQYVIDPELEDHMREFISRNRNTNKVSSLSATELHELYSIMRSLQSAIRRSNERFMDRRGQKISTVSNNTIEKLAKLKDKKTLLPGKLGRDMDSFLNASSIDARTFFKEAEAMPIYEGLHEGMNIRTRDIKEAGEYMEDVLKGVKSKTLDAWRKDTHKLELRDGTLEISTAQAMSLYELLKREQAREHILRGGVRPTIKEKDKSRTRQIEPVQINELEIGKIEELLTPEQIRIADAMQSYMSHEVADKGNETSMRMYGYKKFNEENYFPIKTDKNTTNTNDRTKENNSSMTGILHMGMTKNTVDNANNAIIADDIFNVFTEHIADMATYHGMAMPIADAMRWFNYDEIFLNNDIGEIKGKRQDVSVKKQLERVMGSDAQNFFVALMEDLNGMSNTATDANKAELFAGAYKAAAIGANVRVAIQQPTSYFRAAMEMNPKYLAQALASAPMAEKWANKAQENSMLAWWKSQGFYETSMGKSLEQMILGQSSIVENIKDYSSILAQKGDDWTWGILYRAAELEVSETTDLKYDSPEYKEAVVKRFEDIVDTTQVVDTQLHRTQIMRSKDGLVKTMSAFMSEPMKYYNMLHRAYTEAIREKNAKPVVRALSVYLLTNIATSAAAALIDALRNDDDDTPWEERWLEAFKDNAWDNLNPFHMLPIVSDVFDLAWDGLRNSNPFLSSNSNMNIAAVSSLVTAVKEIEKITNGDKEADYNTVAKITRAIGQFTGIPAYNMLREVRTVHDNMNNFIPQTGDNWYKPSGESTTTSEYAGVYDAIANGGDISQEVESVIQKKVDSGKELSDAQSAVRGTITRKYKQEFIDAYNSGSGYADLKVSISQAYQATGMTKEEADEKVDSFLE